MKYVYDEFYEKNNVTNVYKNKISFLNHVKEKNDKTNLTPGF